MAGHRDGIVSSSELAEEIGVNAVVVRRALGPLRTGGLVEARSGPGGGWAMARDPRTVTLGEVYRAMGSPPILPSSSRLEEFMAEAEAAFLAELDGYTIADLSSHSYS